MGIPGANEREMTSVASTDNHSPASADVTKVEQQSTSNGHHISNSMTNSIGGGKGSAGAADISSEDVDVTSMGDNDSAENNRLAIAKPEFVGRPADARLKGRLKLVRIHVISALFKHPKSAAFREPVNAKALGIFPLYHQVVTTPMDLGTVRKKIDRGEYKTRDACLADIEQVWTNAMTFNAPGHFVHEGAKLLRGICHDKLSRLERDEATGLYNEVLHTTGGRPKPKPLSRPPRDDDPSGEAARKRAVRKLSQELPGEHSVPQHLKKKYVENLSEQMKQCDDILRELMAQKIPRFICEPFLRVTACPGLNADPMDLYKIQSRLQTTYYRHPLHFANDFRRMITETYRFAQTDSTVARASELQHMFEYRFSKIEFEPVDDPSIYDSANSTAASEEDSRLQQLSSVQSQISSIQDNVDTLLKNLVIIRKAERGQARSHMSSTAGGKGKRGMTQR
jgi:hypothetical protein